VAFLNKVNNPVKTSFHRPGLTAFVSSLILAVSAFAHAQNADSPLPNAPQPQDNAQATVTLRDVPKNFLNDQKAIWTSPLQIRASNAIIPIGLVLGTAVLITTDHQVMSQEVSHNPSFNNANVTASNAMLGAIGVAPAYFFVMGKAKHNDHATETGILAAQAMGDSVVVSEVIKIIARRERPNVDNAEGKFFQPNVGFDSSFASNHAFLAWSAAGAIATEYHGAFTQIVAYSLATGVSVTRVLGYQHFPSDVFVGSACGWLIGHYVVKHHRHTY
jgi:membrane-associated phospholipid phosphatase